jgi:CheY-specific phosphatase CheX
MGVQFFGEFLIDRWVITRGQLIEALELQNYRNPRFGVLAMQKGYLTEQQVEQVNQRQRSTDKQFAELAVEMGFLTRQQADEILTYQKNNHLYLGEALLELGHITEDILERELAIFREEQSVYEIEQVAVPQGVPHRDLLAVAVDLTRKMFERVVGIRAKISGGELVSDGRPQSVYHLTVCVPFKLEPPVRFLLSPSSDVAVAIASAILREDATRESEQVVEDAVKEFCNIICGNTLAKLAQAGLNADIEPPETWQEIPPPAGTSRYVVFGLNLAEGDTDLRFLVA